MEIDMSNKLTGSGHERRAGSVFDLAQLVIEGRPHRAMRLYCYRCGKPGTCVQNTVAYGAGAEGKEERMVARKFTTMGWEVDLGRGKHFCPECRTTTPEAKKVKMVMKQEDKKEPDEMNKVVPIAREMGREDRRVIFEKLNEVYINEREGYAPPWTDERIAKDLGTPRAWVSQVREEMFGPAQSNAEIDEAVKAAGALHGEMVKAREQFEKLTHTTETMLKRLDQIIKAIGCK